MKHDQGCEKSDTCRSWHSNTLFNGNVNLLVSIRSVHLMFPIRHPWQHSVLSPSLFASGKKLCHGFLWNMYIRDVSDLSVVTKDIKLCFMAQKTLTFDDVSNIIVDRSNTNRAAVICALLRSSFKSFCLSPVITCH